MNTLETFLASRKIRHNDLVVLKKEFCTEVSFTPTLETPLNKIDKIGRDLALHMRAIGPALIQPNYKTGQMSISWLDKEITSVTLPAKKDGFDLPIPLGVQSNSEHRTIDLVKAPHILVGGTTGSGKSWFLHCAIQHILASGARVVCIDPKMGEFVQYASNKRFSHCKTSAETMAGLDALIARMDRIYAGMAERQCADISVYNKTQKDKIDRVVLVIDEFTDLTGRLGTKFIAKVQMLAQKSRAAGIHIIAAAQNPSAKVFTGEVKANFPVRIAFRVASGVNSRVILDQNGAEELRGAGDGICIDDQGNRVRFRGYIPVFTKDTVKPVVPLPITLKKRSLLDKILGRGI